jgi:hypothetical protein
MPERRDQLSLTQRSLAKDCGLPGGRRRLFHEAGKSLGDSLKRTEKELKKNWHGIQK